MTTYNSIEYTSVEARISDTSEINDEEEEENVTILDRIKKVFSAITIEPVALLMMTGMMMSSMTMQTLLLEKACRVDLNISEEICDALRSQDSNNNTENEKIVQEYVSKYITYKSIITSILPCVLLIFSGGWMDLTGRRKVMMLAAIFGQVLYDANNIINVIFFYQMNVPTLVFSESILLFMFGGWSVLFLAVFSYITDITTEENRTYRIGLTSFAVYIGMPLGISLSGVLLKHFGYLPVFITSLCLACTNGLYIIFKLRDPRRTKEHMKHDNRGILYFLKTFFNPAHLHNSLKVVFKKTSNNRRIMLCILIVTSVFIMGPNYGESAITYLSVRYRFNWNEFQYSMFQAMNMVVTTLGNMIAILLLSKAFGWHDSVLGIISMISKIAASFLYCFASTGTVFFMGPLVDMLNGTATLILRAILTKNVERHEISRLNSILSIAEVLLPLAFVAIYVAIYTHTMDSLLGIVFLVSGALSVPPLLVFMWLFYRHRRSLKIEIIDTNHIE